MSNETNIVPLVDVLSEQLGERVVMRGDDYVHLDNNEIVPQSEVDVALNTQQKLILDDKKKSHYQNWLDKKKNAANDILKNEYLNDTHDEPIPT